VVDVDGVHIGGGSIAVIAGPCAVEALDELSETADAVKAAGAVLLSSGAYKPRTSPYAFAGLRERGLELLASVKARTRLPIVTEVQDTETLCRVAAVADMLLVSARNMGNLALLAAIGDTGKPVLLKRGLSATVDEWLLAAEYIASRGNERVVLCERGIRTFDTHTKATLDLGVIPYLRGLTHLPIAIDPCHSSGRRDSVPALCRAAVAAGADALALEVHRDPSCAVMDGEQSIDHDELARVMADVRAIARALGRTVVEV
jgi:3-deoxy-7-phosphoheptulonate synthase